MPPGRASARVAPAHVPVSPAPACPMLRSDGPGQSLRQRLDCRFRAQPFVARHRLRLRAAADGDRHDLRGEGTALPRGRGALLTLGTEAVLLGPRHATLGGNVFRGLTHVPALEGTPE